MRRALHLLLAFAVLWCGVHLSERPGAADFGFAEPAHQNAVFLADSGAGHEDAGDAVHACHHHCPVATPHRPLAVAEPRDAAPQRHDAVPAAALRSRPGAPPLEPPTT